jgi:hypothetical protein
MRVFWPLRGGIARRFARPIPGGPPASGAPGLGGDACFLAAARRHRPALCFWPLRGGIGGASRGRAPGGPPSSGAPASRRRCGGAGWSA